MGASNAPADATHPNLLRRAEAMVGLRYVPGRFDCAHLAVAVQQQVFGRDVAALKLAVGRRNPAQRPAQAAKLQAARDALARRVPVNEARSGDLVLFVDPAAEGEAVQWHVGTLIRELSEQWVLHTHAGLGSSVLERLPDCCRRGLRLEGFYRLRSSAAAAAPGAGGGGDGEI